MARKYFLSERVALGLTNDLRHGVLIDLHAFVVCRFCDRESGGWIWERADFGVRSLSSEPNGFQQSGEILLKVTVIGESCLGAQYLAAYELGRRGSCSRGIRVGDRVHVRYLCRYYRYYKVLIKWLIYN